MPVEKLNRSLDEQLISPAAERVRLEIIEEALRRVGSLTRRE